jgi:hypothetical protein
MVNCEGLMNNEVVVEDVGGNSLITKGISKEKEFFGKGDAIINYTDVFKNSNLKKYFINEETNN